jgi:hypothetical protein
MQYPLPRTPTTAEAAFKLWTIRQLLREGGIDLLAADIALRTLRQSPNLRIAALAWSTTSDIADRLIERGADMKEFAR